MRRGEDCSSSQESAGTEQDCGQCRFSEELSQVSLPLDFEVSNVSSRLSVHSPGKHELGALLGSHCGMEGPAI